MENKNILVSVPTNPDLQIEIAKTLHLKSNIYELLDIDLDKLDFGGQVPNESIKTLSSNLSETSEELDSLQRNCDEYLRKMHEECAILDDVFQWIEFESKFKKLTSLQSAFNTPFELLNIDAACELIDDNNCLLTCFLDAVTKEDFIILKLQLEPLEWDYHSDTFDVPDEIKNILTVDKNNTLFFLEVIDYYSKQNK